jgi:hypothetical protein
MKTVDTSFKILEKDIKNWDSTLFEPHNLNIALIRKEKKAHQENELKQKYFRNN